MKKRKHSRIYLILYKVFAKPYSRKDSEISQVISSDQFLYGNDEREYIR